MSPLVFALLVYLGWFILAAGLTIAGYFVWTWMYERRNPRPGFIYDRERERLP